MPEKRAVPDEIMCVGGPIDGEKRKLSGMYLDTNEQVAPRRYMPMEGDTTFYVYDFVFHGFVDPRRNRKFRRHGYELGMQGDEFIWQYKGITDRGVTDMTAAFYGLDVLLKYGSHRLSCGPGAMHVRMDEGKPNDSDTTQLLALGWRKFDDGRLWSLPVDIGTDIKTVELLDGG
jgi:hypothetical protein